MTDLNTGIKPQPAQNDNAAPGKQDNGYPEVRYKIRPKVVKAPGSKHKESKLTKLMEYLQSVDSENFTGYIKVNFSQGSIGRIERFEEILRK
jgi:hypothetical protein